MRTTVKRRDQGQLGALMHFHDVLVFIMAENTLRPNQNEDGLLPPSLDTSFILALRGQAQTVFNLL
jgi:hypothetical protein